MRADAVPCPALRRPALCTTAAPSSVGDNEPWIYKKGPAFGMPGVHVDGMDVLKVRRPARHAALRGLAPRCLAALCCLAALRCRLCAGV